MPRPKSVVCRQCNKECLVTSFAVHQKKCGDMQAKRLVDCPHCGLKVDRGEYSGHITACKKMIKSGVKKHVKKAKPLSAAAIAAAAAVDERAIGGKGGGGVDDEMARLEAQLNALRQQKGEQPEGKGDDGAAGDEEEDHRFPCQVCGRKFFEDRIARHQQVCFVAQEKRGKKKIKVHNGAEMRTKGTEFAQFRRLNKGKQVRGNVYVCVGGWMGACVCLMHPALCY